MRRRCGLGVVRRPAPEGAPRRYPLPREAIFNNSVPAHVSERLATRAASDTAPDPCEFSPSIYRREDSHRVDTAVALAFVGAYGVMATRSRSARAAAAAVLFSVSLAAACDPARRAAVLPAVTLKAE